MWIHCTPITLSPVSSWYTHLAHVAETIGMAFSLTMAINDREPFGACAIFSTTHLDIPIQYEGIQIVSFP